MGKKITGSGTENITDTNTGAEAGRSTGNPDPRTSENGGRTSGDRTGNITDKEQSPENLGLSEIVPTPEPKKAPKKRKKKKVIKEPSFNAEQISILIGTISGIFSSRPGFEMFALTPEESGQIAEPLAKILEKSESMANLAQYSDGIALISACFIIFIPKFIMFFAVQKEKKKERTVKLIDKRTDNEKRPDHGNARNVSAGNTSDVQNIHNSIASAIPSII